MSEELAARLMARIAVPPMPFAPDTYTAGRMDQFTEMITQLRALPEVDKEQVLADAKARIEGLGRNVEGDAQAILRALAYNKGRDDALAALTRPQSEEPTPYARAFRERVCPVPEFPGIRNQQEREA